MPSLGLAINKKVSKIFGLPLSLAQILVLPTICKTLQKVSCILHLIFRLDCISPLVLRAD